jgi:hypothetical protein
MTSSLFHPKSADSLYRRGRGCLGALIPPAPERYGVMTTEARWRPVVAAMSAFEYGIRPGQGRDAGSGVLPTGLTRLRRLSP